MSVYRFTHSPRQAISGTHSRGPKPETLAWEVFVTGAGFRASIAESVIGVILVSHGALARVLLETATEIVGRIEPAVALAIARHQSLAEIEARLREAIEEVDEGDGVLILADMFGGTASNVALGLLDDRVEVVTGFNLPMLLKLAGADERHSDLGGLAQRLKVYGQRNVLVASEVLKERSL